MNRPALAAAFQLASSLNEPAWCRKRHRPRVYMWINHLNQLRGPCRLASHTVPLLCHTRSHLSPSLVLYNVFSPLHEPQQPIPDNPAPRAPKHAIPAENLEGKKKDPGCCFSSSWPTCRRLRCDKPHRASWRGSTSASKGGQREAFMIRGVGVGDVT